MRILVFSKNRHPMINNLVSEVGEAAQVSVASDEKTFRTERTNCLDGETILVFFVSEPGHMKFLESQAGEFIDMKLIIYLENSDSSFAARAYRLHPRLVTGSRDSPALLPGAVKGIMAGLMAYKNTLTN